MKKITSDEKEMIRDKINYLKFQFEPFKLIIQIIINSLAILLAGSISTYLFYISNIEKYSQELNILTILVAISFLILVFAIVVTFLIYGDKPKKINHLYNQLTT